MKKIGIIGCGNMGEAIVKGALASGILKKEEIIVSVHRPHRKEELEVQYGVEVTLDNKDILKAPIIILGIKPKDYKVILTNLKEYLNNKHILISMAPGFSKLALLELIDYRAKVIRTMPNTPVGVREGVIGISYQNEISPEEKEIVTHLFEGLGLVVEVEESQMVAIGSLSGSSPAFLFMLMEAMADVGVYYGLSREKAYQVVGQALVGSGKLLLESGIHPGVLKDQVTSPKGTTITGCIALEKAGFRSSIMEGLLQTGELFKGFEQSIEADIKGE